MQNLRFRRQFLLSFKPCDELGSWKKLNFDVYHLYVHPDCGLYHTANNNISAFLIGHALDPRRDTFYEQQILEEFTEVDSLHQIPKLLYSLVGRFVIFIKKGDDFHIYHDACGLRSVYYTFAITEFYAASQPGLLRLVTETNRGSRYAKYFTSKYVRSNQEHYWPSGISLYPNVKHLVPNHFLDINHQKQVRYWPLEKVKHVALEDAENRMIKLLTRTMYCANSRFKLAVPITGGMDSRLILSASQKIKENIQFYTLKYRNLNENSADIKVPSRMAAEFGLNYKVIDCLKFESAEFFDIYGQNSDSSHNDDWGTIALGMIQGLDSDRVVVKGNCVEIGRGIHHKNIEHPELIDMFDLLDREYLWDTLTFVKNRMKEWHEEVSGIVSSMGYDEVDLFYMEHRMGNWQAQNQLEWDIAHETFTPFNNRELIDLMLGVAIRYRVKPKQILFKNFIHQTWPELLRFPINPKPIDRKIYDFLNMTMRKIGVYQILKKFIKG